MEPADAVNSAFERANDLISMCGFEMLKFIHPTESMVLSGAEILTRPNFAPASLPGHKRVSPIEDITVVIKSGHLAPGHSAKLRGRLGFAQSLLFGKFGRVMIRPIPNRQYSRATSGRHPPNAELREVLPWWASVLRNASERRTWFLGVRPIVAYVDAAGCGHLGVTISADDPEFAFSSHCPEWMTAENCDIYDLEITAPLYGLCVGAELFPDRSVIVCCDNRGATQTLVRGACKTEFAMMACATFWTVAASSGIPVRVEEVAGNSTTRTPPQGIASCVKTELILVIKLSRYPIF